MIVGSVAGMDFSGSKAAVIAVGESLPSYPNRGFGLVIGVNRAAKMFKCDFWSAHDCLTLGLCEPIGRPVIITDGPQWGRMIERFPHVRDFGLLNTDTFKDEIDVCGWWEFSVTSALVAAKHLGATEIHTFGCDMSWGKGQNPALDWDGYSDSEQVRNERRWTKEQLLWTRCVESLGLAGCGVVDGE